MTETVMNWWVHQDSARARTRRLVIMMICAVLATISMIYLLLIALRLLLIVIFAVIGFIYGLFGHDWSAPYGLENNHLLWWPTGLWCATGFVTVVTGFCALTEYFRLRKGVSHLLGRIGGRCLDSAPRNFQEQQLLNITQEMAIASNAPVPSVYVLEGETGINAVSIGFRPDDSAIALTRGALEGLSRAQLQAVVAHEMAHILNGDTRLNMIAISMVYGLTGIFLVGTEIIFPDEGDGSLLIGLPITLIGLLGAFAGKMIQVSICRQREYLADACAVQYTRYAPALAEALHCIESNPEKSRVRHAAARELAHMFFSDIAKRRWFFFFRTHPKPTQRISRLGQQPNN